jgi:hypothetical protein
MMRLVKVAKDVAVKARTSAMISLKAMLANAPAELREQLQPLTKMALIRRCAALRPRAGHRSSDRSQAHPACHREKVAGPGRRDQSPRAGVEPAHPTNWRIAQYRHYRAVRAQQDRRVWHSGSCTGATGR